MTDIRIYEGVGVYLNDLRDDSDRSEILGSVLRIKTFASGDEKYISLITNKGYEVVLKGIDYISGGEKY